MEYLREFDFGEEVTHWCEWSRLNYSGRIFHTCTTAQAEVYIKDGAVKPRSSVGYKSPAGEARKARGLWTTLNTYAQGSEFGPIEFSWDSEVLNGRRFLVVERKDKSKTRLILLEYTHDLAKTALTETVGDEFFQGSERWRHDDWIYNIVLTSELPFDLGETVIRGVEHKRKLDVLQGKREAQRLGEQALNEWLSQQQRYADLVTTFPDLVGHRVPLIGHEELQPADDGLDDAIEPLGVEG